MLIRHNIGQIVYERDLSSSIEISYITFLLLINS